MEYVNHSSLKRAPRPPYSPDLALSDFYLFGYVKHQLQGHEFTEGTEFVSAISRILNQIPTYTLVDVFDDRIEYHRRIPDWWNRQGMERGSERACLYN
jgi:hypothetical protein